MMKDYQFTRWLRIGAIIAAVGVLVFAVYGIRYLAVPYQTDDWLDQISFLGYVFIGLGGAVIIADMVLALVSQKKKSVVKQEIEQTEDSGLAKYRTKR